MTIISLLGVIDFIQQSKVLANWPWHYNLLLINLDQWAPYSNSPIPHIIWAIWVQIEMRFSQTHMAEVI